MATAPFSHLALELPKGPTSGLNARVLVAQTVSSASQPDLWISNIPHQVPDGRSIVAIGTQQRGELVRFEPKKERFARYLEGINAVDLDFSRDGRWVTYVRLPDHTLWKAHADGSAAVRLTSPPMDAAQPHWSPNGSRIAFMGSVPGTVYRVYVVSASGGSPVPISADGAEQGVPTWSPDGSTIVFGDRNH